MAGRERMAGLERTAWLVAYDISDRKRLHRVAKCLEQHALRVQYSVFLGIWTEAAARDVIESVRQFIRERKDDLRVYGLPGHCQWWTLGDHPIPNGILLANSGYAYLSRPKSFGAVDACNDETAGYD